MNSLPCSEDDGGDKCGDNYGEELFCSELLLSVEAKVRSAGRYVVPSDDLRPKTMEAARDLCSDKKNKHNIWKLLVAIVIAVFVSAPVMERLELWQSRLALPSAEDLNARATKISRDKGIGPNWALMEVFSELQNSRAARLGHPPAKNISQ